MPIVESSFEESQPNAAELKARFAKKNLAELKNDFDLARHNLKQAQFFLTKAEHNAQDGNPDALQRLDAERRHFENEFKLPFDNAARELAQRIHDLGRGQCPKSRVVLSDGMVPGIPDSERQAFVSAMRLLCMGSLWHRYDELVLAILLSRTEIPYSQEVRHSVLGIFTGVNAHTRQCLYDKATIIMDEMQGRIAALRWGESLVPLSSYHAAVLLGKSTQEVTELQQSVWPLLDAACKQLDPPPRTGPGNSLDGGGPIVEGDALLRMYPDLRPGDSLRADHLSADNPFSVSHKPQGLKNRYMIKAIKADGTVVSGDELRTRELAPKEPEAVAAGGTQVSGGNSSATLCVPNITSAADIMIRYTKMGDTIELLIDGKRHGRYTAAQLGLQDMKTMRVNSQWKLLDKAARNGGRIPGSTKSKDVSLLRKKLTALFPDIENPIRKVGASWKVTIQLVPNSE